MAVPPWIQHVWSADVLVHHRTWSAPWYEPQSRRETRVMYTKNLDEAEAWIAAGALYGMASIVGKVIPLSISYIGPYVNTAQDA